MIAIRGLLLTWRTAECRHNKNGPKSKVTKYTPLLPETKATLMFEQMRYIDAYINFISVTCSPHNAKTTIGWYQVLIGRYRLSAKWPMIGRYQLSADYRCISTDNTPVIGNRSSTCNHRCARPNSKTVSNYRSLQHQLRHGKCVRVRETQHGPTPRTVSSWGLRPPTCTSQPAPLTSDASSSPLHASSAKQHSTPLSSPIHTLSAKNK